MSISMPAGTYYVGDLCYVMDDDSWDEVCNLTFDTMSGESLEGGFTLSNQKPFVMFGTAYGDGEYNDQFGRKYPVDSGTIGCMLVVHATKDGLNGGQIIKFHEPFECSKKGGTLFFGPIIINTDDELDYDGEVFDDWDRD